MKAGFLFIFDGCLIIVLRPYRTTRSLLFVQSQRPVPNPILPAKFEDRNLGMPILTSFGSFPVIYRLHE